MSTPNYEELFRRYLHTHTWAVRFYPKKFVDEVMGCFAYLWDKKSEDKIATAIDKQRLKKVVSDEIENIKKSMENIIDELETVRENIQKDLSEVDKIISQFPNIVRKNLNLQVEGRFALYEIDILSGKTKVFCCEKHNSESLCIRTQESSCCSCKIKDNEKPAVFPAIQNDSIRKAIQVSINLANDAEIEDLALLRNILKVNVCPRCLKDGKLPLKAMGLLSDRITALEEREGDKKEINPTEIAVCPECRNPHLTRDYGRGELVCDNCGLVIEIDEAFVDQGPTRIDTEQGKRAQPYRLREWQLQRMKNS